VTDDVPAVGRVTRYVWMVAAESPLCAVVNGKRREVMLFILCPRLRKRELFMSKEELVPVRAAVVWDFWVGEAEDGR